MILPKVPRPSKADETTAYELATLRDNATCQMCKKPGEVQRDHRQNRQGGNTVVENLQCLCPSCHLYKGEHPRWAIDMGWAVPRWADPLVFPARRSVHGVFEWVQYDNIGGWKVITDEQAKAARSGDENPHIFLSEMKKEAKNDVASVV
ncbi:HNH endonuclease [Cryobacterium sp. Y62]|uniref:HNH endonuclease n=1 Tax=Cryobacterium sp. Y62 TaxID=2048284 RepID=UPI000CE2BDB3|nr:HNH endonuclease signature motif containing protein [Cryobacterium sp. Y62]